MLEQVHRRRRLDSRIESPQRCGIPLPRTYSIAAADIRSVQNCLGHHLFQRRKSLPHCQRCAISNDSTKRSLPGLEVEQRTGLETDEAQSRPLAGQRCVSVQIIRADEHHSKYQPTVRIRGPRNSFQTIPRGGPMTSPAGVSRIGGRRMLDLRRVTIRSAAAGFDSRSMCWASSRRVGTHRLLREW